MPDKTSESPPVEIVDGNGAEILIDRLVGVDVTGGIVRLNLAVDRTDPRTRQVRSLITVRLACGLAAFAHLHDALGNTRTQLERAGVLGQPPAPPQPQPRSNGSGDPSSAAPADAAAPRPRKKAPRRPGRGS